MNVDKRDRSVIAHIHQYCMEIDEACTRFGNDYESFARDKIYRNACVMCIIQIGELVGHLSEAFKETHNEIPWRAIRAMRNIAAHAYGTMNIPTIWNTITDRVPELRNYCLSIIEAGK